jgi:hypothetical protein
VFGRVRWSSSTEKPARLVRPRTSVERKVLRTLALTVQLILFCIQGLVKFAVGFLLPYSTRIRRIAFYYERDGRIIGIYDTVTLLIIVAMVVLLALTDMQHLSFITGLVAGMLIIQVFFHRFHQPLPADKAPESPTPPRKLMSYAIQATPGLAWREIVLMTVLFGWSLVRPVIPGVSGGRRRHRGLSPSVAVAGRTRPG